MDDPWVLSDDPDEWIDLPCVHAEERRELERVRDSAIALWKYITSQTVWQHKELDDMQSEFKELRRLCVNASPDDATMIPPYGPGEITSFDRAMNKAYDLVSEPSGVLTLYVRKTGAILEEAKRRREELEKRGPRPDHCPDGRRTWETTDFILRSIDVSLNALEQMQRDLETMQRVCLRMIRW